MLDLLQLVGAIGILVPFVWSQVGSLSTTTPLYLGFNLVGSSILAVVAAADADWGFLLLEGTWAIVAAWAITQRLRAGGART